MSPLSQIALATAINFAILSPLAFFWYCTHYDIAFGTLYADTSTRAVQEKTTILLGAAFVSALLSPLMHYAFLRPRPRELVAKKREWLPACNNLINDFLRAKYRVTLDVHDTPDGRFSVAIYVDDHKRYTDCLDVRGITGVDERSTRIIADHFIIEYKARCENSALFRAVAAHDEFVTKEKHFKKPNWTVKPNSQDAEQPKK